jgi:hypothetical protein
VNGKTILELDGEDVEDLAEVHGVVEGTDDVEAKTLAFLAMLRVGLLHDVVATWLRWSRGNSNKKTGDHVLEVGYSERSPRTKRIKIEINRM